MGNPFTFPDDVPTLTDGTVTLRAHSLSDVDRMVEQCTDPASIAWTTVPVPYEREDAVRYITDIVPTGWRNRTELCFAIDAVHPDGTSRFSGTVSLRIRGNQSAEIVGGTHPAARGHGFFSRAVKVVLDWTFTQPDIDVVIVNIIVGNWASRRAIWANGFSFLGTVPRFLPTRGERKDSWFGTLRAEDSREPKTAWNVPPVLETDRLRLRPYRQPDAERVGEMTAGETDGATTIHRHLEACATGRRFVWCVADLETDEPMGHVQLSGLSGPDLTAAEVSCSVHPRWHTHEVLPAALRAVTEWSFRPADRGGLGKRRLLLTAAASDRTSRYAAERAGFQHVGTEPEAFATGDTVFEDMLRYHRLNPDWSRPARRKPAMAEAMR